MYRTIVVTSMEKYVNLMLCKVKLYTKLDGNPEKELKDKGFLRKIQKMHFPLKMVELKK
jgi:hypothetical protein